MLFIIAQHRPRGAHIIVCSGCITYGLLRPQYLLTLHTYMQAGVGEASAANEAPRRSAQRSFGCSVLLIRVQVSSESLNSQGPLHIPVGVCPSAVVVS